MAVSRIPPLMPADINALVYGAFAGSTFAGEADVTRDDDDGVDPEGKPESLLAYENKTLRRLENALLLDRHEKMLEMNDIDMPRSALFQGHDDIVVYDMPVKVDPFYSYTMGVIIDNNAIYKKGDRTIVRINGDVLMKPLPCTSELLRKFIPHAFPDSRTEEFKKLLGKLKVWLKTDFKSHELVTYEQVCDAITRYHADSLDKFTSNVRVKRYFLHDRITLMEKYYDPETVATLAADDIVSLSMYFDPASERTPDPADLMFKHKLQQYTSKGRGCKTLRELDEQAWRSLCRLRKIPFDPAVEAAIRMYNSIKIMIKETMGKYVPEIQLGASSANHDAIEKLLDYGAIAREVTKGESRIYLRQMYFEEQLIVDGLVQLVQNGQTEKPTYTLEESSAVPASDKTPCSEQMRLVRYIISLPIVVLCGRGGAGKTDACALAFRHVAPEETLFLTYHNTNASNCRTRVTSRSHTIHKLLVTHANCCHLSPYTPWHKKTESALAKVKKEMGIHFYKCPLEDIRYVIIDECGILCDGLFAALLTALLRCGKLCRLILCGDALQQAQKEPGRLFRDFQKGMPAWEVQFRHNHRMSDATARIFRKNMDAIYKMDPDGFEIDDKCNRHYDIPAGLDPAIHRRKNKDMWKQIGDALSDVLRRAIVDLDFGDEEDVRVVVRTRYIRNLMSNLIKELYHGSYDRGFIVNQKIVYKRTNYDITPNLCNNEILIIVRIEDVRVTKDSKKDKERDKHIVNSTDVVHEHKTTSAPRNSERMVYRRIVCRVCMCPSEVRIIPWTGDHRLYVEQAAVSTEASIQGLESNRVFSVKPGAWDKADTNLSMGMVAGRAIKEMTWIAPIGELVTWMKTPEPKRLSGMGDKIFDAMYHFMRQEAFQPPPDTDRVKALIVKEEEEAARLAAEDDAKKRSSELAATTAPVSAESSQQRQSADHWAGTEYDDDDMAAIDALLQSVATRTPEETKTDVGEPMIVDDQGDELKRTHDVDEDEDVKMCPPKRRRTIACIDSDDDQQEYLAATGSLVASASCDDPPVLQSSSSSHGYMDEDMLVDE